MDELDYLIASVAVYFGVIVAQAVFGNMRYDMKTLLGPRDGFTPEGKYLLRARRTLANMTEAMVMFVPLVLVASLTDNTTVLTQMGAAVFFWSRAAYAIVYIMGAPVVRTLFWASGMIGVLMVFWSLVARALA